jgi:hypothetical protein
MKCSFCEQPLICKHCKHPFQPHQAETVVAAYQPDMQVACPACHKLLICKSCGFVYGEEEESEEGAASDQ